MKIIFLIAISIFSLTCSVQAQSNPKLPFNIMNLPPQCRAEITKSIIIDKVEFDNEELGECLTRLSKINETITGRGFSYFIRDYRNNKSEGNSEKTNRITLKFSKITLGEVLKYLGDYTESNIEMTENGCRVTYGKPPEWVK